MKVENATKMPKRYFGLHMTEGVAEYANKDGGKPLRIFIGENAIKEMNPSFEGCPVFVNHIPGNFKPEDLDKKDGLVVKSFYNELDGKNWVEFMVESDLAHQKISQGWVLSNCYFQEAFGPADKWHGVPYDKEVTKGRYEHLAIVDKPRYSESVILTPDQYKKYCDDKAAQNKKLSNSKDVVQTKTKEKPSMFNASKKEKIENSIDLEEIVVTLPKCKKEMTIASALHQADKFLNMAGYASDEHMVKDDEGEEMSVNDMKKKFSEMKNKMKNMIEKPKDEKKPENSEEHEEDKKKENESDEEHVERKKENAKKRKNGSETDKAGKDDLDKEAEDEKAKNSLDSEGSHYQKLMNAANKETAKPQVAKTLVTGQALGKQNY